MKKIVIISAVFVFLAGCGHYFGPYSMWGMDYMSLDRALARTREPYTYDPYYGSAPYLEDLQSLKEQATSEKDKAIIDQKMAEYRQRAAAFEQQVWREREEREERERLERERLERERVEQERLLAERESIEFETKIKKLIQSSNGTLRDKSAQEVKKLVDGWRERSWQCEDDYKFFPLEFFSLEIFYKVFGKPDRTQFLSSEFEWQSSYYFLYNCKDGLVQIKVRAKQLDDNGIVIIEDLNIF